MKYILISFLILFILILLLYYFLRKRYAINQVKCHSDEEKLSFINAALNPFGFTFDLNKDLVISKNDSWQRNYGFMDLYDYKAPFFNIVMDSQPIYFEYDKKHYRIEFWKGQYGITTGAEIGIYVRDDTSKFKNYYRAANDNERLEMTFELTKKCKLFRRCDLSWWLTGFDIGVFSKPKDLKMSICLKFPNQEMANAFKKGLINAGYAHDNIEVCDNIICFNYCTPSNYKPNYSHKLIKCLAQIMNWINVHIYLCLTRMFNRTIDKLTYLRYMAPCLYKFIIRLCIPRRCKKCYPKK